MLAPGRRWCAAGLAGGVAAVASACTCARHLRELPPRSLLQKQQRCGARVQSAVYFSVAVGPPLVACAAPPSLPRRHCLPFDDVVLASLRLPRRWCARAAASTYCANSSRRMWCCLSNSPCSFMNATCRQCAAQPHSATSSMHAWATHGTRAGLAHTPPAHPMHARGASCSPRRARHRAGRSPGLPLPRAPCSCWWKAAESRRWRTQP